jgi:hypothetical protein
MDKLNKEMLKSLMQIEKVPCISIYLPTQKEWNFREKNITAFKNILRKIEKELEDTYKKKEIDGFLKNARKLLDDSDFWDHREKGLVVLFTPEILHTFKVLETFEEFYLINKRFHLKPLIHLLAGEGKFLLLALDKNEVKLYRGSKYDFKRLKLPSQTPLSFSEAMKWDEVETSYQNRTVTAQYSSQVGTRGGSYHGQGQGFDLTIHKEKILEFFQMVNKGVLEIIKDENAPLILAGVEYLIPIYRRANSYPYLTDKWLDIHPEDLTQQQLHNAGYEAVHSIFTKDEEDARAKYEQFSGTPRASSLIDDIVISSYSKRVESLFVDINGHIWGTFDPEKSEVLTREKSGEGNEDLLDFAAIQTFLNGGKVFVVSHNKMPNRKEAAAIYRY